MKSISIKKRWVSTCFWTDPWIYEDLEPLQKLLFLYFLTNDKTNVAGVYEIPIGKMVDETKLTREQVKQFLGDFEFVGKVRYIENYLILRNTLKHQKNESQDVQKGIQRILDSLPEPIRQAVEAFRGGQSIDSHMTVPTQPIDGHTYLDSDSDSDLDSKEKTKKAAPSAPPPAPPAKDYRQSLKDKMLKAERAQDAAGVLMAAMELMQGVPFPSYEKEWTASKQVVHKIRTVGRGKEPMQLLRSLLAAFQHKRKSSRSEYWREAPLAPSALNCRFQDLIGFAQKEHENANLDEISLDAMRISP